MSATGDASPGEAVSPPRTACVNRARSEYTTGTTSRVRNVENRTPPTTAMPSGRRDSAPAPSPIAIGRMPKTVANDVIRMGRNRIAAASVTAPVTVRPSARSWLANSTIRIAFLVTRPISMIRPMREKMLSDCPNTHSETTAPNTASGTESRMVNGSTKLSNCAASTRKMNASASANMT